MDFKQLSKVSDNLFGKPGTQPKQVPDNINIDDENPLNGVKVPNKGKRITDDKNSGGVKDKVLILDDDQIISIMSSSREKRRAILSKLTDAQRKRVLTRYMHLKKVKDEESSVPEINKLDVLNLDNLASNYLFSPTDFNKSLLQDGLDQYGPMLDEQYRDFFEVLLSDGTAEPKYQNEVQSWVDYMESFGLHSELNNVFDLLESPIDEVADDESDAINDLDSNISTEPKETTYTESDLLSDDSTILEDSIQKKYGLSLKELTDRKIVDEYVKSALNKIEERPFIDDRGNEVQPVEERPLLSLLNEALTEYLQGNPEKLEALASQPVSEESEENPEETPEDESKEPASETNEELEDITTEEEPIDISEDITVQDSVALSKALLIKDSVVISKYLGLSPIVDGFFDEFIDHESTEQIEPDNTEYCIEHSDYNQSVNPINVPLTRDEYCSVASTPLVYKQFCKEVPFECPTVESYDIEGPCVKINGCDLLYPYSCTVEELKEELNHPGADYTKIVGSRCIPLSDACKLAAKLDCLNVLDNRFYKKNLSSPEWCYDTLPTVLKNAGVVKPTGTIQIADYDNGQDDIIELFGTKYILK